MTSPLAQSDARRVVIPFSVGRIEQMETIIILETFRGGKRRANQGDKADEAQGTNGDEEDLHDGRGKPRGELCLGQGEGGEGKIGPYSDGARRKEQNFNFFEASLSVSLGSDWRHRKGPIFRSRLRPRLRERRGAQCDELEAGIEAPVGVLTAAGVAGQGAPAKVDAANPP